MRTAWSILIGIMGSISVASAYIMKVPSGPGQSGLQSTSFDGRYIAYESTAPTLVAGDTNATSDVFVYDRQMNTHVRVSVSTDGDQANGASFAPKITPDGRYVVFASRASNLVSDDTNDTCDIFVRDLVAATTVRASTSWDDSEGNGCSWSPSISASGRFVGFVTSATNLNGISVDENAADDFVIKDMLSKDTRIVSSAEGGEGNGNVLEGSVSADGTRVILVSESNNLVSGDDNGCADIFLRDLQQGRIELISRNAEGGFGNRESFAASFSYSGRYVVFESRASNLISSDTNGYSDVFLRDLSLGTVERVSLDSNGDQIGLASRHASVSADGTHVTFQSSSRDLTSGTLHDQVYVRNRVAGTTTIVSSGPSGAGNRWSRAPTISPDGHLISFSSLASNLRVPPDSELQYADIYYSYNAQIPVEVAVENILTSNGGTQDAFRFTRSQGLNESLTVRYSVGGTASAGVDYEALTGSIIMPAGVESVVLPVNINYGVPSSGETIDVMVNETSSVMPGTSWHASNTINTTFPYVVIVRALDSEAREGHSTNKGVVRISRNIINPHSLTVQYAVSGSSVNGVDYVMLSGFVTIPANESFVDIEIDAYADALEEPFESVIIELVPQSSYAIGIENRATVTIRDEPCSILQGLKCRAKADRSLIPNFSSEVAL